MKSIHKTLFVSFILTLLLAGGLDLVAQKRVVVIPFRNMDGLIDLNVWRYELSDSLRLALIDKDPEGKLYHIVDPDSVEMAISEFNLDPTNVQYESDVWRAVELLNADYCIQGNFVVRSGRVLLNAYVYSVEYKMADPEHQAKDIFRKPDDVLSAVALMAKKLYPALATEH
jgi:hypothetical protein